jgi:hypothetical protein
MKKLWVYVAAIPGCLGYLAYAAFCEFMYWAEKWKKKREADKKTKR